MILLRCYDRNQSPLEIDSGSIEPFAFGGDSVIYRLKRNEGDLVIKAIKDPNLRYQQQWARKWLSIGGTYSSQSIPTQLRAAIPMYKGACDGKELNKPGDERCPENVLHSVFAFDFIDGQSFYDLYPSDNRRFKTREIPGFQIRLRLAMDFLEQKHKMESCGLFSSDCFLDNLIIKDDKVFPIDYCSGGVFDLNKQRIVQHRLSLGKESAMPIPPEKYYDIYSERWMALNAVWEMLTGTTQLLPFIGEIVEPSHIQQMINDRERTGAVWPPVLSQTSSFYSDKYQDYDRYCQQLFGSSSTQFSLILHQMYIRGFARPKARPSYLSILKAISGLKHSTQ